MSGTIHSGRRGKSAAQHRLEGTFQKVRHEGRETPSAPVGRPVRPKTLQGEAAEEWDRMVGRLEVLGTLTTVDDAALHQYACLFAETEAIAVTQLETASTIDLLEENLRGEDRENLLQVVQEITKLRQLEARYTTQVRQGRMAIRQYLVEFGMTPSARTRVKLPDKPDHDSFGQFDDAVN